MSMIQIRGVPEQLHRKLKARAALAGQSLSDYLLAEIKKSVERPTREELLARIRERSRVELDESAADALHAERVVRGSFSTRRLRSSSCSVRLSGASLRRA